MVLRKKENYTIITPIPGFIPRQLAIDILHSHGEVITLNPLVLDHKQIKAPRDAAADEYFSTWYEITERVQFVPGMGRFGSGKINFNACFHDLPWGLQTHVYAPLNIDLRNKYRIAGNQPGVEAPEPPEIGLAELGAPTDGLYLREDIEIRCNIAMVATVKAQMKAASKEMVGRIIKKAELLDSGVLQAMIEDGKMKTYKPQSISYTGGLNEHIRSPQLSPGLPYGQPASPRSPGIPYHVPRPISVQQHQQSSRPGTASSTGYPAHWQQQQQQMALEESRPTHLHAGPQHLVPGSQAFPMELPGDFYYPQTSPQPSPTTTSSVGGHSPNPQAPSSSSYSPNPATTPDLNANGNANGNGQRWSHQPNHSARSVRPSSFASDPGLGLGLGPGRHGSPAPTPEYKAELATHPEMPEDLHPSPPGKFRGPVFKPYGYSYNPADYAQARR